MQNPLPQSIGPLHIAVAHVHRTWIPLSPEVSDVIKENIIHNRYRKTPSLVRKALKTDFALYTHCVREVVTDGIEAIWPHTALQNVSDDRVTTLVNRAPQRLEFHAGKNGTPEQQKLLTQPLIAALFAETLAPKMDVDPESAFSCGIFRHLGLALVAWNYPGTFTSAIKAEPIESIDRTLERRLGFSPSLLGLTIAKEWKFAKELRVGLGERSVEPSAFGLSLRKLCKIGEALARAQDPWYTPESTILAKDAVQQVSSLLGPDGMTILRERVGDEYCHLADTLPEIFDTVQVSVAEIPTDNFPSILYPLVDVVKRAKNEPMGEEEALKMLQQEVFPHSGFISGCVYLLSPERKLLTPRLSLGDGTVFWDAVPFDDLPNGKNVNRTPVFTPPKAITARDGSAFDSIYGILGQSLPVGLLLLRPGPLLTQSRGETAPQFSPRVTAHAAFEIVRNFIEFSLHWE